MRFVVKEKGTPVEAPEIVRDVPMENLGEYRVSNSEEIKTHYDKDFSKSILHSQKFVDFEKQWQGGPKLRGHLSAIEGEFHALNMNCELDFEKGKADITITMEVIWDSDKVE